MSQVLSGQAQISLFCPYTFVSGNICQDVCGTSKEVVVSVCGMRLSVLGVCAHLYVGVNMPGEVRGPLWVLFLGMPSTLFLFSFLF